MNILLENGLLNKMDCGNNFAYVVNDNTAFLPTEYKVLQSQPAGLFIKCMKMLYNGKTQLYYLTDGYRNLMEMAYSLEEDNFITIVANLFADVIAVKNNGFLSCQSIDILTSHIFVEPNTNKVSLVYLPIRDRLFCDVPAFENELRTSLVQLIQSTPTLSSPRISQLAADLMNGMFSFENLYTRTRGVTTAGTKVDRRNTCEASYNYGKLKLVAVNTPVPFEIPVTKDEFILGKKREIVDGVISFNRMISRSHCKIIRQENQYAIVDLGSANGTYLNNVRLKANQSGFIKNGDRIRLADSDFQAIIE